MSVPDAPMIGPATAGNAMAMVSWTPGSDGGSPILSYTVTATFTGGTPSPVSLTVYPPQVQATMGGLPNGTSLSFAVTATNSDGTSAASASSNLVTPAVLPGFLPNILTLVMGAMAQDYVSYRTPSTAPAPPYLPLPAFAVGSGHWGDTVAGPRIVFVIAGGRIGHIEMQYMERPFGVVPGKLGNGIDAPENIYGRRTKVLAYIYAPAPSGGDTIQDAISQYGVAEQIQNDLLASANRIAMLSAMTEMESFTPTDGSNAQLVLSFILHMPVVDYMDTTWLIPTPDPTAVPPVEPFDITTTYS